jgi:hypothetical protein
MFRLAGRNSIYFSILLLSSVCAQGADEPNLKKEQRLHNIYRNFNEKPTKQETWKGVSSGKDKTYSVQKGDNLWDLSETLFGDSQFWPKIWSLNAEKIENPHEIFPSQNIQFTPGTMGEAPTMAVADKVKEEAEEPALKVDPKEEQMNTELLGKAEIPPAPKASEKGQIPPSLPVWTYGAKVPHLDFEVKKVDRTFPAPEMNLNYYLADKGIEALGEVAETEMALDAAAEFQYIFVKLNGAGADKNLMVVKEVGTLKDPISGKTGVLTEIQGEVEVLEPVNSKGSLYRAMVKKSLHQVEIGSKLVAGGLPKFNNKKEAVGNASARIIGGQGEPNSVIYATQNLVFLSGEGLNVGESYPIFKAQRIRNETTGALENPRQIGEVKVIKMTGGFATAVVLHADEEMRVGDATTKALFLK